MLASIIPTLKAVPIAASPEPKRVEGVPDPLILPILREAGTLLEGVFIE